MELALLVYIASILGNLSVFCVVIAIPCFGAGLILTIVKSVENPKFSRKWPAGFFAVAVFFSGMKALLPTEKQAYLIASAYAAQRIAESDNVQQIGGKVVTLLNQMLDEAIDDRKPEKK